MRSIADLSVSEDRGTVLVRLSGELDMSNVEDIRLQMLGSVPNTALGLVLDLSELAYMDSSGVQLLFELRQRLQNRQQEIRVVIAADGVVRRVLEMVGAERSLNLEELPRGARAAP